MPNRVPRYDLGSFCKACSDGDLELLDMMLDRKDPINGFQGDINEHHAAYTGLHYAAVNGQLEVVQALLDIGADPHMKTRMPKGQNPADGQTAAELADEWGWDDVTDLLKSSEATVQKGDYLAGGALNNAKIYPSSLTASGRDPDEVKLVARQLKGMLRPFFREQDELKSHIGLLFPGHGSQHVVMLGNVSEIPAIAQMIRTARQVLNWDPVDICMNGPASRLDRVAVAYPVLFITGAAALEQLRRENPTAVSRPGAVAGLGVGEFVALLAARVLSFEDGLRLVKVLSEALQSVADSSPQALLSVAGIRRSKLEGFCRDVEEEVGRGAVCAIANELFPKGATCGGTKPCMEKLAKVVKASGALQAKLVPCGAFHTPLMAPAVAAVRAALDEVVPRMNPPACDIYMNCTGRAVFAGTSPKSLVPLLMRQLTEPVLWESCVKHMIKGGVSDFYELGPMKQLKAMMKRIDAGAFERMANVEV